MTNRATWAAVHASFNESEVSRNALSGTAAENMLDLHGLREIVAAAHPRTFLDIGVGHGNAARYFYGLGAVVDALDIAPEAEDRVRPHIRKFYLDEDSGILPADTYDLAISHLVAQHMALPDLIRQVRHVSRALVAGGIFSLHVAGSHRPGENDWERPDVPPEFDGRMCRSQEFMIARLRHLLGSRFTVTLAGTLMEWYEFQSYWFFIRIRKKEPHER
jgi:SAM-dependent methyltransferase